MASPEADGAVLATAAALRQVRKMGEGDGTDLLIVGLSATDYVGHSTGTEGSAMCLQMPGLDRELGDFFARLDATGVDYGVGSGDRRVGKQCGRTGRYRWGRVHSKKKIKRHN